MQNKTVLITGGTGGIGKQTALALAKAGAQVIVTGRSQASAEQAAAELRQLSGNQKVSYVLADLSTQSGVRSLAEQVRKEHAALDVLINNAGLAEPARRLTEDGVEADFAVNVIAPFLLTHLLMDRLKAAPAARVVNLTGGQHPARLELDNLQAERSFTGLVTYSHAKLVMMAVMLEFAQRMEGAGVTINVCYPGQAVTSMTRGVTPEMLPPVMRLIWPLFKLATRGDHGESAEKASRSSVYLATSPEVAGVNGKYFDTNSKMVPWPTPVLDAAARKSLWNTVETLAHLA